MTHLRLLSSAIVLVAVISTTGCRSLGEAVVHAAAEGIVDCVVEGGVDAGIAGVKALTRKRECRVEFITEVVETLKVSEQPLTLNPAQAKQLLAVLQRTSCQRCGAAVSFLNSNWGPDVFAYNWYGYPNMVTFVRYHEDQGTAVWVCFDSDGYYFDGGEDEPIRADANVPNPEQAKGSSP